MDARVSIAVGGEREGLDDWEGVFLEERDEGSLRIKT